MVRGHTTAVEERIDSISAEANEKEAPRTRVFQLMREASSLSNRIVSNTSSEEDSFKAKDLAQYLGMRDGISSSVVSMVL